MIPVNLPVVRAKKPSRPPALCRFFGLLTAAAVPVLAAAVPGAATPESAPATTGCLATGDGFLRAHLAGALNLDVDWPNRGTICEGESRPGDAGVRLSFRRQHASRPDLLFVFGLSGVREGAPLQAAGANLTIIVQGTSAIYSTRSDTRCTVDSLRQQRLAEPHEYRVEVRGFCTQPAHAVRGDGDVFVSRFDFAGRVHYILPGDDP
jgi:hypothetical protein